MALGAPVGEAAPTIESCTVVQFRTAPPPQARLESATREVLAGLVERVTFHNAENDATMRFVSRSNCLAKKLTAHFSLAYEPAVTLTGQSIDFLMSYGDQQHYFDVKTIAPRDPEDANSKWEKYEELRELFPTNADLVLAERWMGGEFWHFFSSAHAKFLDYALGPSATLTRSRQASARCSPYLSAMHLDLTDEGAGALAQELHDIVARLMDAGIPIIVFDPMGIWRHQQCRARPRAHGSARHVARDYAGTVGIRGPHPQGRG